MAIEKKICVQVNMVLFRSYVAIYQRVPCRSMHWDPSHGLDFEPAWAGQNSSFHRSVKVVLIDRLRKTSGLLGMLGCQEKMISKITRIMMSKIKDVDNVDLNWIIVVNIKTSYACWIWLIFRSSLPEAQISQSETVSQAVGTWMLHSFFIKSDISSTLFIIIQYLQGVVL